MLRLFLLLPLCTGLAFSLSAQQRYYVSAKAAGQNTGTNWTDAFRHLHDALALSLPGDEVWVAEGTYLPSETGDRFARFQLSSGVRLYGGFGGTEMLLNERSTPAAHPTVLSGDIGTPGDSLDNSYNILYLREPDSTTLVDGFTFYKGLANSDTAYIGTLGASGAAIYIGAGNSAAYPTIRYCRFLGNAARSFGGAVYAGGSDSSSVAPVFQHCYFEGNRSPTSSGGAVHRSGGSRVERPRDFYDCDFVGNWAKRGGAICFSDAVGIDTLQVVNCHFSYNYAIVFGHVFFLGDTRLEGSAAFFEGALLECNGKEGVIGFIARDQYGAGGRSEFYVKECTFRKNTIGFAIDLSGLLDYKLSIVGSNFFDMADRIHAEALVSIPGETLLENVSADCKTFDFGAFTELNVPRKSLRIKKSVFRTSKFAVFSGLASKISLEQMSFTVDTTSISSGIMTNGVYLDNCLFYNAGVGTGYPRYYRSCIFDTLFVYPWHQPTDQHFSHCLTPAPAPPNITLLGGNQFLTDPLFRDTAAGDFRLQPCSPAINAGDNSVLADTTDLAGNPRIQEGTIDIGPYESPAFSLPDQPLVQAACAGAATGAVNWADGNGCEPLHFVWEKGAATDTTVNNLSAGDYTFTVTDARGRSATAEVSILGPPPVSVSAAVTDTPMGKSEGQINLSLDGGLLPFSYHWNTDDTTAVIKQLPAGIYTVTITDGAGCTYVFDYEVKATSFTESAPDVAGGTVMPNPAQGQVQIAFGEADTWVLFDAMGTMVASISRGSEGAENLNIQQFPAGAYFYFFQKAGRRSSKGILLINK